MISRCCKHFALSVMALALGACKIQIEVPQGGSVVTESGEYQCGAGSTCTIEVTDLLFDETFRVETEDGYTFSGWAARQGGLCGGSTAPCLLATTGFAGFPALMALLYSDEVFYLEPTFWSGSTGSVLCDYRDTTLNAQPSLNYTSVSEWTCSGTTRHLAANGIPDHEVGTFPNPANPNTITEQDVSASFPLEPQMSQAATELGGPRGTIAYVINGVKVDAGTGGTCNDSGGSCSLGGNVGNWNIEALGQTAFDFGTDENNAHVQPDGIYHYHGMPEGFVAKRGGDSSTMTLIGWAADGFPIYARYGYSDADDSRSALKVMTGSYRLVTEVSSSRPSTSLYPLGTFAQDYEYVEGLGDLDECNGRLGVTPEFPAGIYHYFATDSYPYFQRCVRGLVESNGTVGPPRF
ncbi:MAG: YHYH protein [Haliea sp.]|uniref:YHYH protein n=1 Tax=Haliea sp. TaxID=1932666 RepID=UPI0032ECD78F